MKYMGSKNRFAKELLSIILKDRKPGQFYVEPFVGGANVIDKVEGERIGADIHPYLIALLSSASTGWVPPKVMTKEIWKDVRDNKEKYDPALVAYVGFCISFRGKYFGGYRSDSVGIRDYGMETYNNAMKQFPKLKGVDFYCCPFNELPIPPNSLIYCDPPYEDTTKYQKSINHSEFWEWCRLQKKLGHTVFVSEYNAPSDFKMVWQAEVKPSRTKAVMSTEKLFTL